MVEMEQGGEISGRHNPDGRRFRAMARGVAVDFGGSILLMLAGIVVTPVILRYLSSPVYGFWMTILQIVGLLSMVEMGVSTALVQRGADPAVSEDRKRFSRLVSSSFAILLGTSAAILAIGLGFREQAFVWFGLKGTEVAGSGPAYVLMVAWFSVWVTAGLPLILLVMRQKLALSNAINNGIQILSQVGVLPFLAAGFGVLAFPAAQILFGFAGLFAAWLGMRKYVPAFDLRVAHVRREELGDLVRFSAYNGLGKIAFVVLTACDNVLIAATLGPAAVTPYLMTVRLSGAVAPNIARLSSGAFPAFAELYATRAADPDSHARFQNAALALFRFSLRTAFLGLALVVFCTERFVTVWVGKDYFCGVPFVLLLGAVCFRDTVIRGITVIIMASGQLRGYGYISAIEAAAKIVLVLFFVQRLKMGLNGVVLGQLVATTTLSAVFFPRMICRIAELRGRMLAGALAKVCLQSLPSLAALAIAIRLIPVGWGWFGLLLAMAACGLLNLACFELPRFLSGPPTPMPLASRVIWAFRSQYQ